MHTAGFPFIIGIPFAPEYVPKYESNERFSCMITMTCLILWMPTSPSARIEPKGRIAKTIAIEAAAAL